MVSKSFKVSYFNSDIDHEIPYVMPKDLSVNSFPCNKNENLILSADIYRCLCT